MTCNICNKTMLTCDGTGTVCPDGHPQRDGILGDHRFAGVLYATKGCFYRGELHAHDAALKALVIELWDWSERQRFTMDKLDDITRERDDAFVREGQLAGELEAVTRERDIATALSQSLSRIHAKGQAMTEHPLDERATVHICRAEDVHPPMEKGGGMKITPHGESS